MAYNLLILHKQKTMETNKLTLRKEDLFESTKYNADLTRISSAEADEVLLIAAQIVLEGTFGDNELFNKELKKFMSWLRHNEEATNKLITWACDFLSQKEQCKK